jgi:Lipocalin-like domain
MKNAILGSWELRAAEGRYDDGSVEHLYGSGARGLLIYTPEGRMTVQLSAANRARFASDDMWKGTSEELKAAFNGYLAYFGRYELNEADGVILHHVEESMFPNWTGNVQRRSISLEGDRLTLSTLPGPVGGRVVTATLVWERSRRATS